ncbi:DUF58 domain-containing protein [Cryobacterium sp. HLT2-28]|uniref:DUF58 domain-containing protein n=1 Tax=Cryobacterium sp. HLT2-28 TaxID=1259146 RepID=UPI0010698969|nr:DUF58 domain-containing protein [Cryobacterium sp. HLT2-28]TFB92665.1 DUF58 domain-containing protein [Cryobacterium sp. HLT2-28]
MSASRRPLWFPRLTLRGGAFLGVGALFLVQYLFTGRRDILFVACLLLLVPVTAAAYVAIRPVAVKVSRTFRPSVVEAGRGTIVTLIVRNLSARPLYGLRWRDTGAPGLTTPGALVLPGLDRFEGGRDNGADAVRLEYSLALRHRGIYSSGPLRLERYDPFGLASSEWTVGEPLDLVVTPTATPLSGTGLTGAGGDGDARERLRHLNHNSDELIAREYRPGDPLRRVNWPATARHGEIMVRQEEHRSNPVARIVLDTALRGRPAPPPGQGPDRRFRHDQAFEVAVELVASVGVHLLDAGFRLDLVELGPSQLGSRTGTGRGGLRGDPAVDFQEAGGMRLLLEGLAGVVPLEPGPAGGARPAPALSGGYAPQLPLPTFAVLVDIDEQDAAELAALGAAARPAVAFNLDTMRPAAIETLRDAGWRCVPVRAARDIPAAWLDAARAQGAAASTGREPS